MTAFTMPPPPARLDETWTVTDLNNNTAWSASRNGVVDSDGVKWIVTSESGWNDPPDVRLGKSDNPRGDGARTSPVWRGSRTVTLSGTAWMQTCDDEAVVEQVRRRWQGFLAAGPRVGSISGTSSDGVTLTCPTVKLADQPRASFQRGFRQFRWQITVTADDPVRYGVTDPQTCGLPEPSGGLTYPLAYPLDYHTSLETGQVVVDNTAGTADTWPRLLIAAPFDIPTVANPDTGDALTFNLRDYTGTDFLLVDTHPARRSVLLNGQVSRRAFVLVTGDWLPCRAGTVSRLRFRAATYTSAQLTVAAPPASW